MPRRKPKNGIQPGQVLNPKGRPVGSKNEINENIRQMFAMLLHNQLPNLEHWIMRAAERNPEKAVDLLLRVSERFLPTLSRTEVTGADGQQFTPITINIPTINLPKTGEGTALPGVENIALPDKPKEIPEVLGESSPEISEITSPGEEISATPDESVEATPQFQFLPELKVTAPKGYKREF